MLKWDVTIQQKRAITDKKVRWSTSKYTKFWESLTKENSKKVFLHPSIA